MLTRTFSDDDRHGVATLQLPLIRHCQGELVSAHLETGHCGNGAVSVLNLHAIGTPGAEEEQMAKRGEKKT